MNLKNIAYLVNEELTTINCAFTHNNDAEDYTYVCHKDLAKTLKEGDLVVVERHQKGNMNMAVVRVTAVHEESEVEPDSDLHYRWAIDKVSGRIEGLKEEHEESVKKLKSMRRKSYRQRLIEDYKSGVLLEG